MTQNSNHQEMTDTSTIEFARTLGELKRNGSNILVTGLVPDDVRITACKRLLGDPEAGPRYRLFVFTDARKETIHARVPSGAPMSSNADYLIQYKTTTRDVATSTTDHIQDITHVKNIETGDCTDLRTAIIDTLSEIDQQNQTLKPASVRLCFDSLNPLVNDCERSVVHSFLSVVTETIRELQGMGHVHFKGKYGSDEVKSFEQLFDVILELQVKNGALRERWHLREYGYSTDWLSRERDQ